MKKKIQSEYTIHKIQNAFIHLLLEKKYDKITISNITSLCQINRTTFYMFYSSKEELLQDICDHFLTWYIDALVDSYKSLPQMDMQKYKAIFSKMAVHADLILALFKVRKAHINPYLLMQKRIEEELFDVMKDRYQDKERLRLFCIYNAANAVATVDWWIHNYQHANEEYIIEIIQACLQKGGYSLLNESTL